MRVGAKEREAPPADEQASRPRAEKSVLSLVWRRGRLDGGQDEGGQTSLLPSSPSVVTHSHRPEVDKVWPMKNGIPLAVNTRHQSKMVTTFYT